MDEWNECQKPIREAACRAQGRSILEMDALVHRAFLFDAGMSFYCRVCGAREQSMQPATYFQHRSECPLFEIVKRVKAAGGWPGRSDEPLEARAYGAKP